MITKEEIEAINREHYAQPIELQAATVVGAICATSRKTNLEQEVVWAKLAGADLIALIRKVIAEELKKQ